MEHVAGYLGLDATLVRERNFMYPKDLPAHPYAPPELKSTTQNPKTASAIAKPDNQNCNGKAEFLDANSESKSGSLDVKGGQEAQDASSKHHTTPDVVCGRFQMKEPGVDASEKFTISAGRWVLRQDNAWVQHGCCHCLVACST